MAADIWPTIHAEREALIADLDGLKPEQWESPTTCGHWNVHQVLGHLVSLAKMTPPKFLLQMAGSGFSFGKYAEKGVAAETAGGPAATLAELKAAKNRTNAPPGPKETWLGEHFVHGEDIRRALGIKREYPLDQVERTLVFYSRSEPIIHGKSRVAGLTLKATDVDVAIGTGPLVEGPVLALLIAASGRKSALDELTGPGVETLRGR
ncbi:MAG TPA: maleylpyruvate isomerase family mycothiol-dependent enzyme [Mycobacteriales bacterium]|nr:maleylpyruvate isomerase family mycothiol-dependent enzyme [Mycobacteriales bacterium]